MEQNLRVSGLIYGVKALGERVEALLDAYDLQRFRRIKCGCCPPGEQTRVTLAKAMLNRPRLLLLDEPTASIDPATAREVRGRIRDFAVAEQGACFGPATICTRCRKPAIGAVPGRRPHRASGRTGRPHARARRGRRCEDLFVSIATQSMRGRPHDFRPA